MQPHFEITVVPKAKANRLYVMPQLDGHVTYKAYTTAPPEDGKANQAVLKLLADHLRLPVRQLHIIYGKTRRRKVVEWRRD